MIAEIGTDIDGTSPEGAARFIDVPDDLLPEHVYCDSCGDCIICEPHGKEEWCRSGGRWVLEADIVESDRELLLKVRERRMSETPTTEPTDHYVGKPGCQCETCRAWYAGWNEGHKAGGADERRTGDRVFTTIRANGDLAVLGQFGVTDEQVKLIEAYGVENFAKLLSHNLAKRLEEGVSPLSERRSSSLEKP